MDAGADWNDFEAQAAALESASTPLSAADCATACKALESLSRAAQHICEVAPDQCEAAKARLKSASDRVHAACPSCEVRAETKTATSFAGGETVALQSAPSHGGCAGCAISPTSSDAGLTMTAVILLAGIGRRLRRRRDLRRVRDELRVEADAD